MMKRIVIEHEEANGKYYVDVDGVAKGKFYDLDSALESLSKAKWKKAYNILMDYFDSLDEETKIEVDERLNEVGL